jgi:cytochrome c oxidase subunit 4
MSQTTSTRPTTQSPSLATYFAVYIALLVLLGATVWAAHIPLGAWNVPVALGIAIVKTVLVALFFMHVRYSGRLIWVVAAGGLVWLAILLSTYHDYYTRSWTPNRISAEPTELPIELLEEPRRAR